VRDGRHYHALAPYVCRGLFTYAPPCQCVRPAGRIPSHPFASLRRGLEAALVGGRLTFADVCARGVFQSWGGCRCCAAACRTCPRIRSNGSARGTDRLPASHRRRRAHPRYASALLVQVMRRRGLLLPPSLVRAMKTASHARNGAHAEQRVTFLTLSSCYILFWNIFYVNTINIIPEPAGQVVARAA
jgi:hypothetical protein